LEFRFYIPNYDSVQPQLTGIEEGNADMSTRRDRERALRREHILQSAERVFSRHPFHETTMQMVASAAELGMQGLYEHFPSKQSLYEAVVLHRGQGFKVRLERAIDGIDDPLEQLAAVARLRIQVFHEAPAFLPVYLAEVQRRQWGVESRSGSRIGGIIDEVRQRQEEIMARAIALGHLRSEAPAFLVHLFRNCVTGVLFANRSNLEEDVERCVERAMRAFLHGTAAP